MATPDNLTADTAEKIFIGKGVQSAWLTLALANRHGLVTGATGTGKTVSSVTRSVTNKVVGGVVADLGKSVGGSIGGSIGHAIVRGALGGLLRR